MDLYEFKLREHIANLKVKNKREAALQEIFEYCIKQLRAGEPLAPAAANYLADALQSVLDAPQIEIPIDKEEKKKIIGKNSNERKKAIAQSLKITAGNNTRAANTLEIGLLIDSIINMEDILNSTRSQVDILSGRVKLRKTTLDKIIYDISQEYDCDERTIRNIYDKYKDKYKHYHNKPTSSKSPSE